jgi:hypothetical protein
VIFSRRDITRARRSGLGKNAGDRRRCSGKDGLTPLLTPLSGFERGEFAAITNPFRGVRHAMITHNSKGEELRHGPAASR